jgi:hypothetical protein
MDSEKARQLDYISKIFSNLSAEKQENALKRAKSLLVIQKNDACHITECMLCKTKR